LPSGWKRVTAHTNSLVLYLLIKKNQQIARKLFPDSIITLWNGITAWSNVVPNLLVLPPTQSNYIYQKTSKLSVPSNHKSAVLGTYVLPVQKLFMVPLRTPVSHVVLSIHGSPL